MLAAVYVQYDRKKYPDSYERFRAHLDRLSYDTQVVIADNKLDISYRALLDNSTVVIGSDNRAWEFSAYDDGLDYIRKNIEYDAVLFANDSMFQPPHNNSLEYIISNDSVKKCIDKNTWVSFSVSDGKNEHLELDGTNVSSWNRSHCFIISKKELDHLCKITTYDTIFIDKCISTIVDKPYFKKDAPMNDNLKNLIVSWLSGFWHSAFTLDSDWKLFRMKTLAFFNELSLSARIRKLENSMYYHVDNAELVIFDVFDTAIFRKVREPYQVFYYMGLNFTDLRKSVETRLLTENSYCSIYDIYGTGELPTDKAQQEIDLEYQLCYKNREIFEVYEYAKRHGKKIIFLSDMYLQHDNIKSMLYKCGYEDVELYVSTDIKCRKDSGSSYEFIKNKYSEINPNKILMIGDNRQSDYNMAVSSGIQAVHYTKCKNDSDFWFKLGYNTIGAITYGYVSWLKEQFKEKEISKAFFFSREGVLFDRVYQAIKTEEDPSAEVVYLSRKSLNIPLLVDVSWEDLKSKIEHKHLFWHLTNLSCTSSINFCEYFGLSADTLTAKGITNDDFSILSYVEREKQQTLLLELIYEDVQYVASKALPNAIAYFKENVVYESGTKIAVVDLGWGGSIQESFIKFVKKYINPNVTVECFLLSTEDRVKDRNNRISINSYLDNNCSTFVHNVYLIESLFNAPIGSCIGYTEQGQPIFDNESCEYCKHIQSGALHFAADAPKMTITNFKKLGLFQLNTLINSPTIEESEYVGSLSLYSSGVLGFSETIGMPDLSSIVSQYNAAKNKAMFKHNLRRALGELNV